MESETSWIQMDDVWLPRAYRPEDRMRKSSRTTWSLEFEWESVNHSIDLETFSWNGMALPRGSRVRDYRLQKGRPVTVATIGPEKTTRIEPDPLAANPQVRWRVVVGTVLLAAIILLVLLRRR